MTPDAFQGPHKEKAAPQPCEAAFCLQVNPGNAIYPTGS